MISSLETSCHFFSLNSHWPFMLRCIQSSLSDIGNDQSAGVVGLRDVKQPRDDVSSPCESLFSKKSLGSVAMKTYVIPTWSLGS